MHSFPWWSVKKGTLFTLVVTEALLYFDGHWEKSFLVDKHPTVSLESVVYLPEKGKALLLNYFGGAKCIDTMRQEMNSPLFIVLGTP